MTLGKASISWKSQKEKVHGTHGEHSFLSREQPYFPVLPGVCTARKCMCSQCDFCQPGASLFMLSISAVSSPVTLERLEGNPCVTCTTTNSAHAAKRSYKFLFPCNLQLWNAHPENFSSTGKELTTLTYCNYSCLAISSPHFVLFLFQSHIY